MELLQAGRHLALERDHVLAPHPRQRALVVAVEVDQALEGLLLAAGKEPVDGALLVGLQVVLEELVVEVAADGVAAGLVLLGREVLGQEGEVVFEVRRVPGLGEKLDHPVAGVVLEPLGVGERDDAVVVGGEGGVLAEGSKPSLPLWA